MSASAGTEDPPLALDCECVKLVGGQDCCDCENGEPTNPCPTLVPPDPPTTPTPTCEDDGGACNGEEACVSGNRALCFNPLTKATRLTTRTDATTSTTDGAGGGSCPTKPTCNTGSCGGGGGDGDQCHASMGVYRRILPSHQTELLSFGRGMAADFDLRVTLYPRTTSGNVGLLFDPVLARLLYIVDDENTPGHCTTKPRSVRRSSGSSLRRWASRYRLRNRPAGFFPRRPS